MTEDYKTPVGAAPPDWRGLCEELVETLDGWHQAVFETGVGWVRPDETYLLDRARAALAEPWPVLSEATQAMVCESIARNARIALAQGDITCEHWHIAARFCSGTKLELV